MALNTRTLIISAFVISGAAALTYQVVWARVLSLVFGNTIYSLSITLSAFMGGLALGAFLMGKLSHRIKNPLAAFSFAEMLIGIYGLLLLHAFNSLPYFYLSLVSSFSGNFTIFNVVQMVVIFAVILIPTSLMGTTLPLLEKAYVKSGGRIGKGVGFLYSSNNFGAIAGTLAAGFLLVPFLGLKSAVMIAAVLNLAASSTIFVVSSPTKRTYRIFQGFLVLFVISVFLAPGIDYKALNMALYQRALNYDGVEEFSEHLGETDVLFHEDGLYGSVAVTQGGEVDGRPYRTLRLNGKPEASTGADGILTQALVGYLPLLVHKNPEKVAIIGLGGGFTAGAVLDFNEVKYLDVIEIDPSVVRAEKYFSEFNGDPLSDSRTNIILTDARNFLFSTQKTYDVIISEPSNPFISDMTPLFTREFYVLAKERLNEGGIFNQWVPTYDLGEENFRTILATISNVFPRVTVWEAGPGDVMLIASDSSQVVQYSRLMKLWEENDEISRMVPTPGKLIGLTFLLGTDGSSRLAHGALLNTDNRPVLEFSAPAYLLKENSGNETLSIFKSIDSSRKRISVMPVVAPVNRTEHGIVLPFMNLSLPLGEEWVVDSQFIEVKKTHSTSQQDEDVLLIKLGMKTVAKFSAPDGGRMQVKAVRLEEPPSRTALMSLRAQAAGSAEITVGPHEGYGYIITSGGKTFRSVTWYCAPAYTLYRLAVMEPTAVGDAASQAPKIMLENIHCGGV